MIEDTTDSPFPASSAGAASLPANGGYMSGSSRNRYRTARDASAAARHVVAYLAGETKDPESGLPHLAHAVTCLMIVHGCQIRGLGQDDRRRLPRRGGLES